MYAYISTQKSPRAAKLLHHLELPESTSQRRVNLWLTSMIGRNNQKTECKVYNAETKRMCSFLQNKVESSSVSTAEYLVMIMIQSGVIPIMKLDCNTV